MRRGVIRGAALVVCLAAAGCGENLTSPTSAQAPFAGQFSGTWAGTTTTASVGGGECVGDDLRATLGAPSAPLTCAAAAPGLSAMR